MLPVDPLFCLLFFFYLPCQSQWKNIILPSVRSLLSGYAHLTSSSLDKELVPRRPGFSCMFPLSINIAHSLHQPNARRSHRHSHALFLSCHLSWLTVPKILPHISHCRSFPNPDWSLCLYPWPLPRNSFSKPQPGWSFKIKVSLGHSSV